MERFLIFNDIIRSNWKRHVFLSHKQQQNTTLRIFNTYFANYDCINANIYSSCSSTDLEWNYCLEKRKPFTSQPTNTNNWCILVDLSTIKFSILKETNSQTIQLND